LPTEGVGGAKDGAEEGGPEGGGAGEGGEVQDGGAGGAAAVVGGGEGVLGFEGGRGGGVEACSCPWKGFDRSYPAIAANKEMPGGFISTFGILAAGEACARHVAFGARKGRRVHLR
jgi:hypothetical protein